MNYVPPSHACQDKVKSLDPRSSPLSKTLLRAWCYCLWQRSGRIIIICTLILIIVANESHMG